MDENRIPETEELTQNSEETVSDEVISEESTSEEDMLPVPEVKKPTRLENLYDWFEVMIYVGVIVVMIFTCIGRMATVNGDSMTNTLSNGDFLFVNKAFYTPERYDIVVVQKKDGFYSDELLVKRIIAKGGETITFDFENWTVTVDGITLYEPYVRRVYGSMEREDIKGYTVTVPEGCYFVMGDNRNGSSDSRSNLVGFVKESEIVGHAVFRLFPLDHFGSISYESTFN